jgi:ABC-2 type transport system permease protein
VPVAALVYLTGPDPVLPWVTFVVGCLYGAGLLAWAVVSGGRRLDRRAPELLGQLAHAQL